MSDSVLDFRSDTVTRPTAAMRSAMAAAEVGDDVFHEDPTVQRLEERIAGILGKEAALFVPSGTMSNQIGLRLHCGPGDELICDSGCHIFNYEQGGYAQLSGVAVRTVDGEFGVMRLPQLRGLIRGNDDHVVQTRLLCIENTHNRGGGRIQPYDVIEETCRWAHANHLRTHLDGARLFNAVVATGIAAEQWARHFDTVSVCFSKGLGAPVGSALSGPRDLIKQARRHRKLFGGGMRQAGVIAAAALYALEHHVARLAEDHAHAQIIAEAVRGAPGLELRPEQVDSNIVIFEIVDSHLGTAAEFGARLRERGLLTLAVSATRIRIVTHLDVDRQAAIRAGQIIHETAAKAGSDRIATAQPGASYAEPVADW